MQTLPLPRNIVPPIYVMAMTQINPITGSIIGSSAAQRVQGDEKAAQLRRVQTRRNNTAAGPEDELEKQIQSPEELQPIGDEHHRQQPRKRNYTRRGNNPPPADDGEQLDIKA